MKKLIILGIMLLSGISFCMETFDPLESQTIAAQQRAYILAQINDFFSTTVAHHKGAATIKNVTQSPANLSNDLVAYFVLPKGNVEIRAQQTAQRAGIPIAPTLNDSASHLAQIIDTFFKDLQRKKDLAIHHSDYLRHYSIIINGTSQTPVKNAELIAIYPNPSYRPGLMGSSRFNQVYITQSNW
jgi:hypothetical protein